MSNVIQLLPDSVANQIAAGEVIQRPASIVKELMENAIDAGCTEVKVLAKEAGRTLIQVIDNGCGMTETDARMAFERHATSKIRQATDLFSLHTMGFRGEALASIAAVAQVELLTRRAADELGTRLLISASNIEKQEVFSCATGSQFIVKNLFFNIPARRRFLKSNTSELKHIVNEFQRIALANPQLAMSIYHNEAPIFILSAGNLRQRVASLAGKSLNAQLVPIETDTTVVRIGGFIGTPETARKSSGEQYFFVNNRYMKHPYLHRAVLDAYHNLIPQDVIPAYYIYLEVDPQIIDVNIHPTKTEIKFEDERIIWQILNAAVRESLGKFNVVPSIDFDAINPIEMPFLQGDHLPRVPEIQTDPFYNPFHSTPPRTPPTYTGSSMTKDWETLFGGGRAPSHPSMRSDKPFESYVSSLTETAPEEQEFPALFQNEPNQVPPNTSRFFQLKNRYILTAAKSGLMVIDQRRAHERILFEEWMRQAEQHRSASQKLVFPETIPLSPHDHMLVKEIVTELHEIGLELEPIEGSSDFRVTGIPSQLDFLDVAPLLDTLLHDFQHSEMDAKEHIKTRVVQALAAQGAIPYGRSLTGEEMSNMFDRLFACEIPTYSPSGKTILTLIDLVDLESRFK